MIYDIGEVELDSPAMVQAMNNPAMAAVYDGELHTDISGIYEDEEVSDGPGIWDRVLSTGLEGFRVREARKAMRNRPLSPDEASVFTRANNANSLSSMGTSAALLGIAAVVVLVLWKR